MFEFADKLSPSDIRALNVRDETYMLLRQLQGTYLMRDKAAGAPVEQLRERRVILDHIDALRTANLEDITKPCQTSIKPEGRDLAMPQALAVKPPVQNATFVF